VKDEIEQRTGQARTPSFEADSQSKRQEFLGPVKLPGGYDTTLLHRRGVEQRIPSELCAALSPIPNVPLFAAGTLAYPQNPSRRRRCGRRLAVPRGNPPRIPRPRLINGVCGC
jgi:hypothetical protein